MQETARLNPDDIRAARKALGLSQRAFADALGVQSATVENWEYGKTEAPKMLRLALAALFAGLPPYGA
ncbi:MAG: helix-turn-helix domain-containing protein [Asticcacaulis sp.]